MNLPTRPLGTSGLEITTVGFGAWAIGGGGWAFGWGPQDDADSLAAMGRALELGINWIDTAAVYGLGHSEAVVGRLLRELPASERPLVFTKCGLVWDERDRMTEARRVLRPESIRQECEASLRRLGVERIDLYQFHWPDETGTPVEDSWQAMVRLVEEGKVRAAGVSNFAVPLLERCEAIRHVDSLQPPFSLIRREWLIEFPDRHEKIPVWLIREFICRTPEICLFSSRTRGRFGPQMTNSLYFTLLPGNGETETGSLETASSSGESANSRSQHETLARMRRNGGRCADSSRSRSCHAGELMVNN